MSDPTNEKQPRTTKKPDWKLAAASMGGKIFELAVSGLVIGVSGAIGQRLVLGAQSPVRTKLGEGENSVVPFKKAL